MAAPRGPALADLLKTRSVRRSLSITTPTRLREAVFRARVLLIARRAAHDLADKAPHLATGVSYGQIAVLFMVLTSTAFGLCYAPRLSTGVLGALMGPLFLSMIVLRMAPIFLSNPIEPTDRSLRIEDANLPVYTIVAALYREKRAVARFLDALAQLDYPASKLDIKLVLEADDRETMEALRTIDVPGNVEILIAPPGEPRTKPRALNVALSLARGRYTVIFDAEDVPDPGQLRLVVSRFAEIAATRRLPAGAADHRQHGRHLVDPALHDRIRGPVRRIQSGAGRDRQPHRLGRHLQPFPHLRAEESPWLGCLERHRGRRSRHSSGAAWL